MTDKTKNVLAVFIIATAIYWLLVLWVMEGQKIDRAETAFGYCFFSYVVVLMASLFQQDSKK